MLQNIIFIAIILVLRIYYHITFYIIITHIVNNAYIVVLKLLLLENWLTQLAMLILPSLKRRALASMFNVHPDNTPTPTSAKWPHLITCQFPRFPLLALYGDPFARSNQGVKFTSTIDTIEVVGICAFAECLSHDPRGPSLGTVGMRCSVKTESRSRPLNEQIITESVNQCHSMIHYGKWLEPAEFQSLYEPSAGSTQALEHRLIGRHLLVHHLG
jgi:hypothetical protein